MAKTSALRPQVYLQKARQEIETWEKGKQGYLSKLGDFVLNPAAKLTEKTIPRQLQTAASQVIVQTLQLVAQAGAFSVDVKGTVRKVSRKLKGKRALGRQLQIRDDLAKNLWTSHCAYAAAHGAATGAIGLAGFVADIPLLLSIAIREIRSIGLCYGYDPHDPDETTYVLHILRLGSSGEAATITKSLRSIKAMEKSLAAARQTEPTQKRKRQRDQSIKYLITLQEYAKSLAIELVQRRALQLLPIVGAFTGASFNAAYANDVGRAAYMSYRRRFLEEKIIS